MKSIITQFEVQQIIFLPSQFFTEAFSSIFSYVYTIVFLIQNLLVKIGVDKESQYLPQSDEANYTL